MGAGEVEDRTQAALDLAGTYVYGTDPGRIPAALFEAYEAATAELDRALLGAALARCWAYANHHTRATPFAVAAVKHAEAIGDATVMAHALDAALATHWGPDELEVRMALAAKLADVAAHLSDVDARTAAHLWLLTVAAESLDLPELNRNVRALEVLGEESRRARFFAATRRLMLDLMRGRTDTIGPLLGIAEDTMDVLPDGPLVLKGLVAFGGVMSPDHREAAVAEVRAGEAFAEQEGVRTMYAEAAWFYAGMGMLDDAVRLASTFDDATVAKLPRDQDHIPVLHMLLDVGLATGLDDLVDAVAPRLMHYAGRAVVNSGAVLFQGVTDDTLARAFARRGDTERAEALREKALATYRRIGASWWRERLEAAMPASPAARSSGSPRATSSTAATTMSLRPGPAGVWLVGRGGEESAVPARRGFEHLHVLLSHPGVEITALQLGGGPQTVEQSAIGEVVDEQALAAYRRRLVEIDEEMDLADSRGEAAKSERLAAERDALLAEVSAATGLGGRRRTVGSSSERARVSVRKAIATALDAIHAVDPVVARHLTTHIQTGHRCAYHPDEDHPIDWSL